MIAHSLSRHGYTGLRPMNPARDLGPVTELLSVAFVEELNPDTEATLREMRMMAGFSPLLSLLSHLHPNFYDLFSGFVWEEAGRVVGNVTMTPFSPRQGHWLISNVAVHPDSRRRGIGRRLMEAAIERIYRQGGAYVSLEVRQGNVAARRLYDSMGFQFLEAGAELAAHHLPPPEPVEPGPFRVRSWSSDEGARVYELIVSGRTPAAQRWLPLARRRWAAGRLRLGLEGVRDLLTGQRTLRRVVEHDGQLCAMARLTLRTLGRHEGEMMIHSRWAGRAEELLVSAVLEELAAAPSRPTRLRVLQAGPALVSALESQGFTVVRILERMGLALGAERRNVPVRIQG